MKRRLKLPLSRGPSAPDANAIVQVKVWLLGISPMVWRRVLVPSGCTLRELHGVFQVAMGWEGIHLYQFCLRAARYGSWEPSASSPDVTLAALQFRKGARFVYEYDLNIPWRHEVRRASLIPYAAAAGLLADILPITSGTNATTLREHVLHVAERAESRTAS